jgi:hypothetical protein
MLPAIRNAQAAIASPAFKSELLHACGERGSHLLRDPSTDASAAPHRAHTHRNCVLYCFRGWLGIVCLCKCKFVLPFLCDDVYANPIERNGIRFDKIQSGTSNTSVHKRMSQVYSN